MSINKKPEVGDIQKDANGSEWVIVSVHRLGPSRVLRNSLAHKIHARSSEVIARSLQGE